MKVSFLSVKGNHSTLEQQYVVICDDFSLFLLFFVDYPLRSRK